MPKYLFALIKSLSMSEKRHFKLSSAMHVKGGKNNYVRLFEAIEKQDQYDEPKLIRSEKYIVDFSVLKNRLYDAVLKSLRSYNANATIKNKLKADVDHIEILRNKGLADQANKLLQRAKKKAEKFKFLDVWLELFDLEISLIKTESFRNTDLPDIEKLFLKYRDKLNDQLSVSNNLLFEIVTFKTLRKLGQPKDVKEEAYFMNMLKPYYVKSDKNLNYTALLHNYQAKSAYNNVVHNYSESLVFNEKKLALMGNHPHQIENNPIEYAKCIYNCILSLILLEKYSCEKVFVYLKKLKEIDFKNKIDRTQYLIIAYFLEMSIYCRAGEFEKGLILVDKAKKSDLIHLENKNEYSDIINISLSYFIAYTYFGVKDYKQCKKYLNRIINYNSPVGTDYIKASFLFRLILDFETGNLDKMEYSLKAAYRYLYRQSNAAPKAETLLFEFIRQQLKDQLSKKELIKSMNELRLAFVKLKKDKFERSFLSDFDYINWLDSKIQNRPFAEIVREKAKK